MKNWFKSSYSSGGDNCVEVRIDDDIVNVRHSRNGFGVLHFTHDEWEAFTRGVKALEFDL
jgi:hypothetical protein